jgi:hypothetical protein
VLRGGCRLRKGDVVPARFLKTHLVTLVIEQFRTELKWLSKLERELPHRAPARHPAYAQASQAESRKPAAR